MFKAMVIAPTQGQYNEFPKDEASYGMVMRMLDDMTVAIAPAVSPGLTGEEFVPAYIMEIVGNLVKIIQNEIQQNTTVEFGSVKTPDRQVGVFNN